LPARGETRAPFLFPPKASSNNLYNLYNLYNLCNLFKMTATTNNRSNLETGSESGAPVVWVVEVVRCRGCQLRQQAGQSLLEIIIVIGVVVALGTIGVELMVTSLRGNQTVTNRDIGVETLEEIFEGLSAATTEDFENIANLTKGTTAYHVEQAMGSWTIVGGTEDVVRNGVTYTRSFSVQNICRDTTTRDITGVTDSSGADTTCTGSGGEHDPSTQRIAAVITWPGGETLESFEYASRWRNQLCTQTAWSQAGSGPDACPTTDYSSTTNVTAGTEIELTRP